MKKKPLYNYTFAPEPQPGSIEQMFNRAIQQHQRGNFQQAEELYRRVLQKQPKHAYAMNLLGVLVSQYRKDHLEAERLIAKAIRIDPDVADYHNNLGLALQQQGKYEAASGSYTRATQLNPQLTMAWFGLGNVSVYLKDVKTAIDSFTKVIAGNPDFLPAWNNLGNVYREIGRLEESLAIFNKVLALKPDFAEGWYNLGVLYKAKGEGENAVAAFNRAIALNPDYLKAYSKRGNCRRLLLNDIEGALLDFEAILEKEPHYIPAYILKAGAFQQSGRFDEAEAELRKALDIDASSLDAYVGLVSARKYNDDDLEKLHAALEESDLEMKQLEDVHFSLGKIFDERKEYAKAFQYWQRGNALHRGTYEFELKEIEKNISSLIQVFDQTYIRERAVYGLDSDVPVFIVGMPRSGTTLTEQIIASHPDVFGAGELVFIGNIAGELSHQGYGGYPECLQQLPGTGLTKLAHDYLTHIRGLHGGARRITDKMPGNFLQLGLISILFPQAKIIHCRRNPLDTCLSIFEQKFIGHHPYAYDLTELGLYYGQYSRLMAHWENVLPPGRMLTVHYEALLEDQEGMSRRLIDHTGLPWDESCLLFYETERSVATASHWQVRQKLYTTSKERWRNYEPWLQPLIEALGDVIEPNGPQAE